MNYYVICFVTFCLSLTASAQEPSPSSGDEVFVTVDEMPEFPGGDDALIEYLGKNIKYPEVERKKNLSGVVYVYFIVDKEGKVKDPKVVRGVKDAPALDAEALRVVKEMPNWKPGKQNDKPAAVQFTLPIKFVLGSK